MAPDTNTVDFNRDFDLSPDERAQLARLAEKQGIAPEELVAAALKEFLASAAESALADTADVSLSIKNHAHEKRI